MAGSSAAPGQPPDRPGVRGAEAPEPWNAPREAVVLNEAIRLYLLGGDDPSFYEQALDRFDDVLEHHPDHHAALLFRALTHGQMGLAVALQSVAVRRNEVTTYRMLQEYQRDPARLEELAGRIADVVQQLEDDTLPPHERHRLDRLLRELQNTRRRADEVTETEDQLQERIRSAERAALDGEQQERAHYAAMKADLDRLMGALQTPADVLRLLEVVTFTKLARLDEGRAKALREGVVERQAGEPAVNQLRAAAERNLYQAAQILEEYLRTDPSGMDAVRGKFFLGVVRYRRAVPRRAVDERPVVKYEELEASEQLMVELADEARLRAVYGGQQRLSPDEEAQLRQWQSFSELYVGLIRSVQARRETGARHEEALTDARAHLKRAVDLDFVISPEGTGYSKTSEVIPDVVNRQLRDLERAAEAPAVSNYINDFRLTLSVGAHRDTNVILLGERTDLSRGITDEEDFGFTLRTVLDYTVSLGRIDPALDRWTIGLQGRMDQNWHTLIHEFDEQTYGGSIAIQYALVPEESPTIGPVFLGLQYDFSTFLLGRNGFLDSHRVTPSLRVFFNDRRGEASLFGEYTLREYRETLADVRFDRDGNYFRIGTTFAYDLVNMTEVYKNWGWEPWGHPNDSELAQEDPRWPNRYLRPSIGLRYGWDSTQGDEFDQTAWLLALGLNTPLPWGLELDTSAEWEWQRYGHGGLTDFHRRVRRDFIQRYNIGVFRTFVLRGGAPENRFELPMDRVTMTVGGQVSFTHDDSNVVDRPGQAIFEYDRVIYGLSVAFSFN